MAYAKVFQKGAFKNESGSYSGLLSPGWGNGPAAGFALGTDDAIPYLSLGKSKTIGIVNDDSIISEGFADVPRKVSSYVEQSISCVNKFDGINKMLYWVAGLEDEVLPVVCYVTNAVSTLPVGGNTYSDGTNTVTFLRREVNKDATYLIFTQSAVVAGQSGTLTRTSGSGDATITFTAHSGILYEHIFQFDPHERHLVAPRSEEQLAGYTVGDLKCRMATIGVNMDADSDIVTSNAMCKRFSLSSNAGALSELAFDYLGHSQTIGDADSPLWTYPATLNDSDNNIVHHQMHVQLGTAIGSMTSLGVTSLELSSEIPLQVIQDTISGLYLVEPVMEGKYSNSINLTLSRYSATTWQTYRDAWTEVVARISATSGYLLQEFLVNNAVISQAGPDEDNVSKEPLKLDPGYLDTNRWSSYMYGSTLSHSPIMVRVRNTTSANMALA